MVLIASSLVIHRGLHERVGRCGGFPVFDESEGLDLRRCRPKKFTDDLIGENGLASVQFLPEQPRVIGGPFAQPADAVFAAGIFGDAYRRLFIELRAGQLRIRDRPEFEAGTGERCFVESQAQNLDLERRVDGLGQDVPGAPGRDYKPVQAGSAARPRTPSLCWLFLPPYSTLDSRGFFLVSTPLGTAMVGSAQEKQIPISKSMGPSVLSINTLQGS